jgi:phosphatidylglycerophosphate synthase
MTTPTSSETAYQPASRRPIADAFRTTATLAVRACLRWGIPADAISYASIVAAALAGACFLFGARQPWLLLVGPLFCYVRLWLNMLDGMVALASGKASLRGEILNDLPDRVSDVLVFVGLAHSGLGNPFLAYWAAILALFTAYVGTFGQAVAGRREFGGIMSKPWRMVTVHLGAWTTFATLRWQLAPGGPTPLDWTCLLVIAGCVQTVWVRLASTLRLLARKGTRP